MKLAIKALFLLLCIDGILNGDAVPMKNVGYLALGYNIYTGNPQFTGTGADPGFIPSPIFQFETINDQTADGRYLIPIGTNIIGDSGCQVSASSEEIIGKKSYSQTLENNASINGEGSMSGFGAKFSASLDYKQVSKDTSEQKSIFISSKAECSVYSGAILVFNPPKLSQNFINGVDTLKEQYNQDDYVNFIQNFGTHFIANFKMGARYGFISKMTVDNYTKLLIKNINVSAAASASYAGVTAGTSSQTKHDQELAEEFNKARTDYKTFSLGKQFPSDGKPETWANDSLNDPMPISYKLLSIAYIFKNSNIFKLLPQGKDYNKIYDNMKKAYGDYCQTLKSAGQLSSCEVPEDDKPLPKIELTGSCRFCSTCGNGFEQESGSLAFDSPSWWDFFWGYGKQCNQIMGKYGFENGMKLCCKKEDNLVNSSCKQCLSCGNGYEYAGGFMCDRDWKNFLSIYDEQCNGDLRQRLINSGQCAKLCCKKFKEKPICNVCASCGGDWKNEVGTIGEGRNWPGFFRSRGRLCAGEIKQPDSAEGGVRLCCSDKGIFNGKKLKEISFLE